MFNWLKETIQKFKPFNKGNIPYYAARKYNPELISQLKQEHQQLLNRYKEILEAVKAKAFGDANRFLQAFDAELRAHLWKEHAELYVYLEYVLAKDSHSFKQMHELRLNMDHISSDVISFIHRYTVDPINETTAAHFKKEFEQIGKIIVNRIQQEETSLYNLYQPS